MEPAQEKEWPFPVQPLQFTKTLVIDFTIKSEDGESKSKHLVEWHIPRLAAILWDAETLWDTLDEAVMEQTEKRISRHSLCSTEYYLRPTKPNPVWASRVQEWFTNDGDLCATTFTTTSLQLIISQGAQLRLRYDNNVVWIEAVAKARPNTPKYCSSTEEKTDSSGEESSGSRYSAPPPKLPRNSPSP